MKKILFVMHSLTGGGAEKALINLLNLMDADKYDVSVQLFENRGINLEYLPKHVKLLPDLKSQQWLMLGMGAYIKNAVKCGRFDLIFKRIKATLKPKFKKNNSSRYKKLCAWRAIRNAFPCNAEHYDVAIAYLQGMPIYYVLDCVKADRKIGWMHIDYSKIDDVPKEELLEYYQKLDAFVSMSQKCVDELKAAFPSINERIKLLHNLNSPKLINELSTKGEAPEIDSDIPSILSIGRLCEQKGYDYAIDAAKLLKDRGVAFRWYVLGVGELDAELKKSVNENRLDNEFVFLGLRSNPYPYIRKATIIAQTSRYEGKSIALDEAKIMKKPILVTNYNSASDQIEHGKTGYIVDINAQAIADGLANMLADKELCTSFINNLVDTDAEQEYWLNKHYEIFEG